MLNKKKQYKTVFLDLDDTLWDTQSNSRAGLECFYHEAKLRPMVGEFDQFSSIYFSNNNRLWDLYHKAQIAKPELIVRRFRDTFAEFGITISDEQALCYNDSFLGLVSSQTRLVPYAIELLEYLRPKYSLHLLSNGFQEVQFIKMNNTGLDKYFDEVILSDHIGYTKPHPILFEHALSLTNSRIQTSIMIGDNFSTDIIGAQQIQMDQIYFSPDKEEDLPFRPTYWVNRLKEIEKIL